MTDAPDTSVGPPPSTFIEGDWHFDIPVQKHPAIVYELQVETEVDGNPVIFDKVAVAPSWKSKAIQLLRFMMK